MKIRDQFMPYCVPCHDEREIKAVTEVVESGWWTRGPKTDLFEKKFAEYVGAKYALAVNSNTAATHIAFAMNGIGAGDEIIMPTITFCSDANTAVLCGAKPVFADCDSETGLIIPESIEEHITENTKVILPVHYAGRPCDMDKINAIAKKHNILVIEDAAHAIYTTYKGKMIGSGSNPTAFSFYSTKNLATGEGGMLTLNTEEEYSQACELSLHGMSHGAKNRYSKDGKWRYEVHSAGFKFNTTDFASALGLCQLEKLEEMQHVREKYAAIYNERFASVQGVDPLPDSTDGRNAWHIYGIKIRADQLKINRDQFIEILSGKYLVGASVHFIPIHTQPFYCDHFGTKEGDCPNAEKFFSEIISIPLNPGMSEDDVNYVADAVAEIAAENAK